MTDKEKKSKIADILLEFYDEYQSNEINRPMIPNIYAGKILDSLQEEPTIPDIVDEHWWEMLGEDPANEDLKKEIEIYMGTNLEWDSDALRDPIESWGIKIARHFAAWQKEQDKQWLAENHKHIFAKGRESAEVWISADDDVNNAAEKTTRRFCKISLLSGDYLSLAEAQPQVNKESKLIAIKSFVCGAQWDRNKLMKEAVEEEVIEIIDYNSSSHHEYSRLMIEVDKEKFKEGDKVRVLIIKED